MIGCFWLMFWLKGSKLLTLTEKVAAKGSPAGRVMKS